MLITHDLKMRLLEHGISTLWQGEFGLPEDSAFEPPCSLKWMTAEWLLRLGAFSYAVSGYDFGAKIGRYTSIGECVQIGRGSHPVAFASTSPVFYRPHSDVFQMDCPEAKNFEINSPYLPPNPTLIGNDVYIGHGAFLMQGITIGDGAVIGACSVVTKDVPPYSVAAGCPAVIRKMRFSDSVVERMQSLQWWQYAFWDLSGIPVADPIAFLDFVAKRKDEGMVPYAPDMVSLSALVK